MASHFASIGLPVESNEEFVAILNQIDGEGTTYDIGEGAYVRWESHVGPELWVQLDGDGEIVGVHPHFTGPARMRVRLNHVIHRENHTALDGSWHAWAEPNGNGDGLFPFVFDAPDFRLHDLSLSLDAEVQIAAFAHELTIYGSEKEFDSATSRDEPRFGAESFIPSGLFRPDNAGTEIVPEALAIFTGRIIGAETRTNPLTKAQFHWALVKTYGGLIDVVADPELVTQPLREGGILSGSFWLSGRIC